MLQVSTAAEEVRWGTVGDDGSVTWTGSGDFAAALEAANKSDKDFYILLVSDTECVYQAIKTSRNVTIDLNGKTLSSILPEYDPGNKNKIFIKHYGPGTLTVADNSSDGGGRLTGFYSLATIGIYGNADLIVDGCTIESTCPDQKEFGKIAIYRDNWTGKITVRNSASVISQYGQAIYSITPDSVVEIADSTLESIRANALSYDTARISGITVVRGGNGAIAGGLERCTFDVPMKITVSAMYDGSNPEYVYDDYYHSTHRYFKFEPAPMVAQIGDEQFADLQQAVDAVTQDGQKIEIIRDIDLPDTVIIRESAKSFTIDLNGHKISSHPDRLAIRQMGKGTLTITDSSKAGGGVVTSKSSDGTIILRDGSIVVSGGTVEHNREGSPFAGAICNEAGGSVSVVANGVVKDKHGIAIKSVGRGKVIVSGSALVSGSVFYNPKNGSYHAPYGTIYLQSADSGDVVLEISGGTIENTDQGFAIYNGSNGKIAITGGSTVISGGHLAMNQAPDIKPNAIIAASKYPDGGLGGEYDQRKIGEYKYLKFVFDAVAPEVYNASSKDEATIWLSGGGYKPNDLLNTKILTSGSDYTAMMKLEEEHDVLDTAEIVAVFGLSMKSGMKSTGYDMYVNFDMSAECAEQAFTLVYKKAGGGDEYFYAMADDKGHVTFGPIHELSTVMLVQGTMPNEPMNAGEMDTQAGGVFEMYIWGINVWWFVGAALVIAAAAVVSLVIAGRRRGGSR